MSHATLFNTLLKLSTALETLFRTSPTPSKTLAIPPTMSTSFFRNHTEDTKIPATKILSQSTFPFSSVIESHKPLNTFTTTSPTFLKIPTTEDNMALIPLIKPCIKFTPSPSAITEGEWIPSADAKAVMKLAQNSIILEITLEALSEIPF